MGRGSQGIKLLLFLYLLPCSRICRRDSCSSSRASSSGGRSSSSKGPFDSLPLRRKRVLLYRCTLRSRITPTATWCCCTLRSRITPTATWCCCAGRAKLCRPLCACDPSRRPARGCLLAAMNARSAAAACQPARRYTDSK
jgi:hypothetical protein